MLSRLERARELVAGEGLDCLLLTKPENVTYLTGFTGDSGLAVVTADRAAFVTDKRYAEQAAREIEGWEVLVYERDLPEFLAGLIEGSKAPGVEDSATLGFYNRLRRAAGGREISEARGLVEELRALKEPSEVLAIRGAVRCASEAWDSLLPMIRPGVTERQLASALDYRMVTAGADKPAFDTIVASGPNSSMPHARVTDRALEEGDLVVVDFGARKEAYCCDVTRTVSVGTPDADRMRALDAVRRAWDAAFERIATGVPAAEVDGAAREQLASLGMERHFKHSLGHGVGLEVHERPTLSRLGNDTLEAGMVFTLEPGVYLDGEYGVRHEETVLLAEEGVEILTREISLP